MWCFCIDLIDILCSAVQCCEHSMVSSKRQPFIKCNSIQLHIWVIKFGRYMKTAFLHVEHSKFYEAKEFPIIFFFEVFFFYLASAQANVHSSVCKVYSTLVCAYYCSTITVVYFLGSILCAHTVTFVFHTPPMPFLFRNSLMLLFINKFRDEWHKTGFRYTISKAELRDFISLYQFLVLIITACHENVPTTANFNQIIN